MAEIDRLDIVIATSVKDAKTQISQLQRELRAVQKTLSNLTSGKATRNTGKNVTNASDTVRKQSRGMVREYKKAATMMSTIRDKMMTKAFDIPDTATGAKKALEQYQKMYATARDKVKAAQAHGENYGKVYRNQVEQMYSAAQGIKAARQVLNEKAAKDEAYQRLIDEERAAREAAKSVETLAASYDDVSKSAKSYTAKYVNRSLVNQYKNEDMRIGASPFIKSGKLNFDDEKSSYKSLRDTVSSVVDSIRSKAQEMRSSVATTFDNMKSKVDGFKVAMREKAVASGILSYTQDFVTLQKSIERSRAELGRLTQAMEEYKAAGGSETDKTYKRYQARAGMLREDIDASMKAAKGMKQDGSAYEINTKNAQKNLENLKSSFDRVINSAKRAAKAVGSFVLKISGLRGAANKARSAMNNVTGTAKRLVKELTRVTKMLKLMVTRMALRAVINNVGDGFKSLAIHSELFNERMSGLINSAKTLGYSIAGMVSPLINALAPALIQIIDLVTRAVNALNQLFSALAGFSTWNRAKKFTDSWADSIKGASGAAKELKKTVLGFDELNQLQDNKSGGGGGSDIADMFETVDIDPKWKDFKKWLEDMWEVGDFTELGKLWGTKLRDALESIPWDKIRETSNKLGKSLATLINGFVEVERLGYDIGHTIAQGINTVFEFINGFVHNLHWDSIGKFIADTFNGFFESIDWDLIKDTVVTGMRGLADTINSFVRNFHWDNLSDFISKGINTIVEGIYTFVKRVDWKELGTHLGDQLNKTIKKIDWKQLGRTIGAIIQSAIDFVKSFLKQLDWKSVKKAIQDLLSGFFEEVNKDDLAKLITGILVVIMGKAVLGAIASAGLKGLGSKLLSSLFGTGAVSGATAAASSAGLSIGGAIAGGVALGMAGINLIKDPLWDLTVKLGANKENVDNLKEAYSGWDGTCRIVKESLQEFWYTITGQEEKLDELRNATRLLTDEQGNATKTIDGYGNAIIEFDNSIGTITKTTEGQIKVYDNARASIADYTDAVQQNADRMIDIKVGIDDYGRTVSEVSETILPKLGEKSYEASTAQESLSKALDDYRAKLEKAKEHQQYYKTHLDVIREAQKENVKEVEASAKQYQVLTDDVGKATIVIQDSKPAYDTARDAAKDASEKVADYVASADDVIKVIPDMNKEVSTVKDTMDDVSSSVSDSAETLRGEFSKDKWTLSGVNEGLSSSFGTALESVKEKFKSAFQWINDKLKIDVDGKSVKLGKIGGDSFATGGFPEDGIFFANHSEMVGKFSNGKTAVANNEQIVAGIERGVFNAVSSAMASQSNNQGYIANNIYLDGNKVATAISRSQEKQNRRYSPAY